MPGDDVSIHTTCVDLVRVAVLILVHDRNRVSFVFLDDYAERKYGDGHGTLAGINSGG